MAASLGVEPRFRDSKSRVITNYTMRQLFGGHIRTQTVITALQRQCNNLYTIRPNLTRAVDSLVHSKTLRSVTQVFGACVGNRTLVRRVEAFYNTIIRHTHCFGGSPEIRTQTPLRVNCFQDKGQ